MGVIINDSVKEVFDEMLQKDPYFYSIVKRRASAEGVEDEGIYKWLIYVKEDEWQKILDEVGREARKSLFKITRDAISNLNP